MRKGSRPSEIDALRGQPIELFDGRSLKGWEKANGKPAKNWIVEESLLTRKASGGDLYHKHWYRDFELDFVWKIPAGGNSGVKYRVQKYGNQNLGCEYQLFDDQNQPFSRQSTASLYGIYEPANTSTPNPVGDWNHSRIVVCGNRIEHWLNGRLVVCACSGDSAWLSRVTASKFGKYAGFGQNREGRLFLQDHGQPVWFRKLSLTPLACPVAIQSFATQAPQYRFPFQSN